MLRLSSKISGAQTKRFQRQMTCWQRYSRMMRRYTAGEDRTSRPLLPAKPAGRLQIPVSESHRHSCAAAAVCHEEAHGDGRCYETSQVDSTHACGHHMIQHCICSESKSPWHPVLPATAAKCRDCGAITKVRRMCYVSRQQAPELSAARAAESPLHSAFAHSRSTASVDPIAPARFTCSLTGCVVIDWCG